MWQHGEVIRITVPGVPRALERNRHRIVTTRDKRQFVANYLPSQSAKEQSTIRWFARQVMADRAPLEGPVDLRVVAYMPIAASWSRRKQAAALADQLRPHGRPDADNILKNVCDSIQQIVFRGDEQIVNCAIWKRFSDRPRIVAEIRVLTWSE